MAANFINDHAQENKIGTLFSNDAAPLCTSTHTTACLYQVTVTFSIQQLRNQKIQSAVTYEYLLLL